MKGQRLRKGMHLRYGGREYTIEKRLPSGELQLRDIITEEHRAVNEHTLRSELFKDNVVLLGEAREYEYLQEKQKHTRITDLTALDDGDEIKKHTDRRLAYVREAVAAGITKFTEETLRPIIERVSRVIGDANPPSRWSVHRWIKDFVRAGEDERAVVPAVMAQGNRSRKISKDKEKCDDVLRIINEVIREKYLSPERPTVDSVYSTIVVRIAQENKFRKRDPLPTPHKSTVYREVKKLDPYERDVARLGKRIADLRHQVVKQGERPTRPLERVEADETKLNLFVIDEVTKMPLGRPWLITLICVHTKRLLS